MIKEIELRVPPDLLEDEAELRRLQARALKVTPADITASRLLRRSIDARSRAPRYALRFRVWLGETPVTEPPFNLDLQPVHRAEPAIIVGFGPAGMFAALRLIELGIRPIVLERGKEVRKRRHDIAAVTKRGEVDEDSNYCFGEGGAGTFSDGKLYTRSHKRGSVERILNILVKHGASPDILIDAHPHIGTNKLPALVQDIRETIRRFGGEIHFEQRVAELLIEGAEVRGVRTKSGERYLGKAVILATGHSARDIFQHLDALEVAIERKPFALGVRVEHPQAMIDRLQYRTEERPAALPAASYSLTAQVDARGVFSFCMCPGGIICPAATSGDEVVVNGWSPSKRNSYFANSGIVVEVRDEDLLPYTESGPLAGVRLQKELEQRAFTFGGGKQVAPAQRLADFLGRRESTDLPSCSYLPGVRPVDLHQLFPPAFGERLRLGFEHFNRERPGYVTNEALILAVESRTSSPVRIPRAAETGMHPQLQGLFPTGEGAGYAGGIMSAAMDGERQAEAVGQFYGVRAAAR